MDRKVFEFNYTLRGMDGKVLDDSADAPLSFLEGAGQIIPALEAVILGMAPGDKKNVKIDAKNAYGLVDDKMKMDVDRKELAHLNLEIGSFLRLDVGDHTRVVRVAGMTDSSVTLDGNHPLAGQDLEFDVELVSLRSATPEELSHGHSHGPGGHHH